MVEKVLGVGVGGQEERMGKIRRNKETNRTVAKGRSLIKGMLFPSFEDREMFALLGMMGWAQNW